MGRNAHIRFVSLEPIQRKNRLVAIVTAQPPIDSTYNLPLFC